MPSTKDELYYMYALQLLRDVQQSELYLLGILIFDILGKDGGRYNQIYK
jgi:hypothetical protein